MKRKHKIESKTISPQPSQGNMEFGLNRILDKYSVKEKKLKEMLKKYQKELGVSNDRLLYILQSIQYTMEGNMKIVNGEKYDPKGTPISLEDFVDCVYLRYGEWEDYIMSTRLEFYGSKGLKEIIESDWFELDKFTNVMIWFMKAEEQKLVYNFDDMGMPIIVGGKLEGYERNRFIGFDEGTQRLVVRHFLWNWIKRRGKYKKLKPALWKYLKDSAEDLNEELGEVIQR